MAVSAPKLSQLPPCSSHLTSAITYIHSSLLAHHQILRSLLFIFHTDRNSNGILFTPFKESVSHVPTSKEWISEIRVGQTERDPWALFRPPLVLFIYLFLIYILALHPDYSPHSPLFLIPPSHPHHPIPPALALRKNGPPPVDPSQHIKLQQD